MKQAISFSYVWALNLIYLYLIKANNGCISTVYHRSNDYKEKHYRTLQSFQSSLIFTKFVYLFIVIEIFINKNNNIIQTKALQTVLSYRRSCHSVFDYHKERNLSCIFYSFSIFTSISFSKITYLIFSFCCNSLFFSSLSSAKFSSLSLQNNAIQTEMQSKVKQKHQNSHVELLISLPGRGANYIKG